MKPGSLAKSDVLAAKSGRSLSTIMESPASARQNAGGGSRRHRRLWIAIIGAIVVVVAVAIGVSVYFATRPETVPVVETMAEETLPSLIKVAPIENTGGAILLEYTELLQDDSTVFYYVTTQDFNTSSLAPNISLDGVDLNDPDYLALYLTRSAEPTLEDLPRTFQNQGTGSDTALRIGVLSTVDFPVRLPDTFLPGNFNGAILVHEQGSEEMGNTFVSVAQASFSVIVDPEKNIGSGSSSTETPKTSPPTTTQPTKSPTMPPSTTSPTSRALVSPPPSSRKPTEFPTPALRGSTPAPSLAPAPANVILSPVPANILSNISIDRSNSIAESLQTPTEPVPTTGSPTSSPVTAQISTPVPTPGLTPLPTNPPVSVPTNLPTPGPTPVPTRSSWPTNAPTNLPSLAPTNLPTAEPTNTPTNSPSPAPTNLPTEEPTTAPTNPPVSDSLPILTSELSGSYNIDGTITIDYVQGFENGQVVDRPRLQFDIPNLANAPGPYLYLSKRPYSETRRGDLDDNEDIFIPIDSGEDGQFNVKGRFDQFLDEIDNAQDLEDYTNGSWIVWCRPFGVWIGGGEITAS